MHKLWLNNKHAVLINNKAVTCAECPCGACLVCYKANFMQINISGLSDHLSGNNGLWVIPCSGSYNICLYRIPDIGTNPYVNIDLYFGDTCPAVGTGLYINGFKVGVGNGFYGATQTTIDSCKEWSFTSPYDYKYQGTTYRGTWSGYITALEFET